MKNDQQILPSNSSESLSSQILFKASRRGLASAKRSMMSSLLSAFNLAGCIAILAKLQIRSSFMLVRRDVRSLLSWLKLLSPSLDVIGYVKISSTRILVWQKITFRFLYRSAMLLISSSSCKNKSNNILFSFMNLYSK